MLESSRAQEGIRGGALSCRRDRPLLVPSLQRASASSVVRAGTNRRLSPHVVVPLGSYGTLDKDTANELFLDLKRQAGATERYMRSFHEFRRRIADILLDDGATPQEI